MSLLFSCHMEMSIARGTSFHSSTSAVKIPAAWCWWGCWGLCAHKESNTKAGRLWDKETKPGTKLYAGSVEEGTGHLILSSVL